MPHPSHSSRFYTQTVLGEQYRLFSSSLCSFFHSPVTSSILCPNILLSTQLSNALSLRSSLSVSDQVSVTLKCLISVSSLYKAAKLHLMTSYTHTYNQGWTNLLIMWEPSQISRYQKCDMKQVPFLGPPNIRCHCTKFGCLIDLSSRICAVLLIT